MTDRLHIFVAYSNGPYEPIFKMFLDSWQRAGFQEDHIHIHKFDLPKGPCGFRSDAWYAALRTKMDFFQKQLHDLKAGDIGMFLDADIQFLNNVGGLRDIVQMFDMQNLDFMFMREADRHEVNGGCFFARNTQGARRLVEYAIAQTRDQNLPHGEQTAFNRFLRLPYNDVEWRYIPDRYVVWADKVPKTAKNELMIHHAVCCYDIPQKLEQMRTIAKACVLST